MIKQIDCYEITAKILIRKNYWHMDNDALDKDIIADKIQQGIEVPIEDIIIVIKK
jgi:hypothetical protein